MMQHMADSVEHIYLALGSTNFRRQITGLTAMVALQFKMDPYSGNILFLFCNKRHTAIKALRWDGNGFLLATKCLANDIEIPMAKNTGRPQRYQPQTDEVVVGRLADRSEKDTSRNRRYDGHCLLRQ